VTLSSSFAGTQEYMAMEKLSQLRRDAQRTGRWDLIIVDTPPARSALDFLDAPERLSGFLEGRFIRLLLAPAKGPARFMTAGVGAVTSTMAKVVGAQVLKDLQLFVAAFDTLFGGFRARAQQTYEVLQTEETAFLVVAAPEEDALREAAYFVERLSSEHMPLAGLVVNRATLGGGRLSAAEATAAADRLAASGAGVAGVTGGDQDGTTGFTAGLLRLHAERMRRVAREEELQQRFRSGHPEVPVVVVPTLASDVHDLDGLRRIGELLAG
jgi:anion-transporting  ArsA/GET3 family ATPase